MNQMTKNIKFTIDVVTDNGYDLKHRDMKTIQNAFNELFPNDNVVVYYDDDIQLQRYFVSGSYQTIEFDMGDAIKRQHSFTKIIELPEKFTLDAVLQIINIDNLKSHNITCLSKLQ